MSLASSKRSEEFLKISGQFKLGALITESSHPVTANVSEVAKQNIPAALDLLFQTDADVVAKFREFARSGRTRQIADAVWSALASGGRIFFTGCGSTGRLSILLDSVWRDFWCRRGDTDFQDRTRSVMAGGDYALIKAVEGFEDFIAFGRKQMHDLGIAANDVVFAITEGGETSFVIGTAWAGVDVGAKVYFVYNNPDDILCEHVKRSREVIQDARIEKINLTTGPMAITGSTRMQATSIQLGVMLMLLEVIVRELAGAAPGDVPAEFLAGLEALQAGLRAREFLADLARLVTLEETTYAAGNKNSYLAGRFGIDVLTDTTERSPTFCTPPFRKFDDDRAAESWAFLFVPEDWTDEAWLSVLKRKPRCVEWSRAEIAALVEEQRVERMVETVGKIGANELMRYKIGANGVKYRPLAVGDCTIAVLAAAENDLLLKFQARQFEIAQRDRVRTGLLQFGTPATATRMPNTVSVSVPLPAGNLLLDGVTRVAVKMVMNALSTCTMVRLGRVMGNCMVWVVPSNLKLIDRATRYITQLSGLPYEQANGLLFEVIEHVEPRMRSDQAYPPVVGMAVLRARERLSNEEAEARLTPAR